MGPGPIYGRASHPRGRRASSTWLNIGIPEPGPHTPSPAGPIQARPAFEATFQARPAFEAIVNRHTKPDPGQPQPGRRLRPKEPSGA